MKRLITLLLFCSLTLPAARNIANGSTGIVNMGTSSSLALTGDMSLGMWINIGAGNLTTGGVLIHKGCRASAPNSTSNILYDLNALGASNAWNIQYIHQNGSNNTNANTFSTNIANNVWTYVGFTRDTTAKTVVLYTGSLGGEASSFGTFSYANNPTDGSSVASALSMFSRVLCGGAGTVQLDDSSLAHLAIWNGLKLTAAQHTDWMYGRSVGLSSLVKIELDCYSTEPDWSGNGFSGAVTNTTCVDNPPIGPSFASLWRGMFLRAPWAWGVKH